MKVVLCGSTVRASEASERARKGGSPELQVQIECRFKVGCCYNCVFLSLSASVFVADQQSANMVLYK